MTHLVPPSSVMLFVCVPKTDVTPCGSPTHTCCHLDSRLEPPGGGRGDRDGSKNRSYSTTALYHYQDRGQGRQQGVRERQTVCSLHPLGDHDVNHLDRFEESILVARGLHDGTGNQSGGAYSDRLRRLQKLPNQHVEPIGLCDDCTNRNNNYPDSTTTSPTGPPPPPQVPNKDTTPSPLEACECKCGGVVEGVVDEGLQKPPDARSVSEVSVHLAHPKLHARVATSDYESSDSPSSVETSEEALGMGRVKLVAAAAEGAAAVAVKEEQEEDEEKLEEERRQEEEVEVEEEVEEENQEEEETRQVEVEGEVKEKKQQTPSLLYHLTCFSINWMMVLARKG
ncbi:hypothetical protein Pcinc_040272 [Petrolisthes cinctipes]|uniref:Uncharacterized protein n=1 Tax=Petrolisthes cinctipes TaxID=88211 RepID=A0AAE1BM84_PETCI|nr:hypothetical protein Pcinc_040272 [Petrolisthes cinctipes]